MRRRPAPLGAIRCSRGCPLSNFLAFNIITVTRVYRSTNMRRFHGVVGVDCFRDVGRALLRNLPAEWVGADGAAQLVEVGRRGDAGQLRADEREAAFQIEAVFLRG